MEERRFGMRGFKNSRPTLCESANMNCTLTHIVIFSVYYPGEGVVLARSCDDHGTILGR